MHRPLLSTRPRPPCPLFLDELVPVSGESKNSLIYCAAIGVREKTHGVDCDVRDEDTITRNGAISVCETTGSPRGDEHAGSLNVAISVCEDANEEVTAEHTIPCNAGISACEEVRQDAENKDKTEEEPLICVDACHVIQQLCSQFTEHSGCDMQGVSSYWCDMLHMDYEGGMVPAVIVKEVIQKVTIACMEVLHQCM